MWRSCPRNTNASRIDSSISNPISKSDFFSLLFYLFSLLLLLLLFKLCFQREGKCFLSFFFFVEQYISSSCLYWIVGENWISFFLLNNFWKKGHYGFVTNFLKWSRDCWDIENECYKQSCHFYICSLILIIFGFIFS